MYDPMTDVAEVTLRSVIQLRKTIESIKSITAISELNKIRRYNSYQNQIQEILDEIKGDLEDLTTPDSLDSRMENWAADSRH